MVATRAAFPRILLSAFLSFGAGLLALIAAGDADAARATVRQALEAIDENWLLRNSPRGTASIAKNVAEKSSSGSLEERAHRSTKKKLVATKGTKPKK